MESWGNVVRKRDSVFSVSLLLRGDTGNGELRKRKREFERMAMAMGRRDKQNKTKQKQQKKNTQKNKPSEGGRGEEEAPDDRCAPSIPYTLPRPRSPHPDFRVSWVNRPLTLPSVLTAGWPIMASPWALTTFVIYMYVLCVNTCTPQYVCT